MSSQTGISWTDSTWTPVKARRKDTGKVGVHCVKVSPECTHCYSETFNKRNLPSHGTGLPFTVLSGQQVDIFLDDKTLLEPLKWRKPRRIFVCSQTDLFADFVTDEMIDRLFTVMALCPQHTFQVLTKRPARMKAWADNFGRLADKIHDFRRARGDFGVVGPLPHIPPGYAWWPLANVWLGVTAGTQAMAHERIPHLLNTHAAVRFISVEPQLEPVRINAHVIPELWNSQLHWVIQGGESGHGARPFNLQWARDLRDQCEAAGVAYFLKQLGAKPIGDMTGTGINRTNAIKLKSRAGSDIEEWPLDLQIQEFPKC